jgi:ABC-type dipeptide/oligopeptide/nickel transport system permease subunit
MDMAHSMPKCGSQHWLGAHGIGWEVLSRLIYGTRTSLLSGVEEVRVAASHGVSLGLIFISNTVEDIPTFSALTKELYFRYL